jgi:hypothetical protein
MFAGDDKNPPEVLMEVGKGSRKTKRELSRLSLIL